MIRPPDFVIMREKTTIAIDEDLVRKLTKLLPYLWALVAGAFALGGWVLLLQYRMTTMETKYLIEQAERAGITSKVNENEKRITVLETKLDMMSDDVRVIRDDVKQLIRGK